VEFFKRVVNRVKMAFRQSVPNPAFGGAIMVRLIFTQFSVSFLPEGRNRVRLSY
jgi:hypothetical protein